jgi:transposase-like protein
MNEVTSVEGAQRRWSRQEWAKCVALFERSGLRSKTFCREQGLAPSTFSYWRRRLREASGPGSEGKLVEVRPVVSEADMRGGSATGGAMRIAVPGGIWMDVREGTDACWVAGVIRALARSPE